MRHLWASLLTYRCENGGSKEHRLYVAPLIDALLGFKIDSLLGCHRNCLFVFEQFVVNVFTVNHRIPTSVENKSNKIFPLQDDQSLKLSQFTLFKRMLYCLEYLKKMEKIDYLCQEIQIIFLFFNITFIIFIGSSSTWVHLRFLELNWKYLYFYLLLPLDFKRNEIKFMLQIPNICFKHIPPLILFSCMQIFMFFKLVEPAN